MDNNLQVSLGYNFSQISNLNPVKNDLNRVYIALNPVVQHR